MRDGRVYSHTSTRLDADHRRAARRAARRRGGGAGAVAPGSPAVQHDAGTERDRERHDDEPDARAARVREVDEARQRNRLRHGAAGDAHGREGQAEAAAPVEAEAGEQRRHLRVVDPDLRQRRHHPRELVGVADRERGADARPDQPPHRAEGEEQSEPHDGGRGAARARAVRLQRVAARAARGDVARVARAAEHGRRVVPLAAAHRLRPRSTCTPWRRAAVQHGVLRDAAGARVEPERSLTRRMPPTQDAPQLSARISSRRTLYFGREALATVEQACPCGIRRTGGGRRRTRPRGTAAPASRR